ncbi:glutamyl-tRNA(Gln) amidotransferase subunit A, mitochondrial-like [Asterias rubens]|uniref:glutamyl-tRNA(Gln) amidotransferase subunit A, mitochondrial-like n=1 Tax=Asterias rubens TaxID=7604 RepID=UPI001455D5F0|nr:glutamyl-tRNA(Gln) amidotransferase subunit A, mitochondrial-like [Asterias rubens]
MERIREIALRLRSGALSADDLLHQCQQRARKLQRLNAFITQTPELAQKQSEEAGERYKKGKPKGKLDGIPIAVKDNFSTKGIETTCASRMLQGYVPPYTATVVQRLLDEGAVLMGKTNMDEFAMGSGTIDSASGPTQNIWGHPLLKVQSHNASVKHQDGSEVSQRSIHTQTKSVEDSDWFISGGSSGGSAVAVASGMCFAALGSDTGGSVRHPASYSGVVGFKPTYGLCSRHGLIPLVNSLDVPGILAKSVDDVATVLGAIAGHDPLDSTTVTNTFEPFELDEEISLDGLHIGIPKEFHFPGLDDCVLQAWSRGVDLFEKAGVKVSEVSVPNVQYSTACYSVMGPVEVASNMARYDGIEYGHRHEHSDSTELLYAATRHEGFNDVVRGRILAGNYFLLKDNYEKYFLQAQRVRRLIANDFQRVFRSGVDVLLTPSSVSDARTYKDFVARDNRKQQEVEDVMFMSANLAGIPAISVPAFLSPQSMPIGLQLIGQGFKEKQLLTVSKWLEQQVSFPWQELQRSLRSMDR